MLVAEEAARARRAVVNTLQIRHVRERSFRTRSVDGARVRTVASGRTVDEGADVSCGVTIEACVARTRRSREVAVSAVEASCARQAVALLILSTCRVERARRATQRRRCAEWTVETGRADVSEATEAGCCTVGVTRTKISGK